MKSEHVRERCRQNKNKTEIAADFEKSLQISFLKQGLRSLFRRSISDYYCCILTVPSMPTGVVILVWYNTLTRRKELAV